MRIFGIVFVTLSKRISALIGEKEDIFGIVFFVFVSFSTILHYLIIRNKTTHLFCVLFVY